MGKIRPLFIFSYDIVTDWSRRKVAHLLESRAVRVQKSVFEVRLTQQQAENLFQDLSEYLEPGDSLRVYKIPAQSIQDSMTFGGAPLPEQQEFWLL